MYISEQGIGVCKTLTQGANEQTTIKQTIIGCGVYLLTKEGEQRRIQEVLRGEPPPCTFPPWGNNLSLMDTFLYTPLRESFEYIYVYICIHSALLCISLSLMIDYNLDGFR